MQNSELERRRLVRPVSLFTLLLLSILLFLVPEGRSATPADDASVNPSLPPTPPQRTKSGTSRASSRRGGAESQSHSSEESHSPSRPPPPIPKPRRRSKIRSNKGIQQEGQSHDEGEAQKQTPPSPPEEHSHHPAEDSGNVKEKGEESHPDGGEHTHELPPPPPEEHSHHPAKDLGNVKEKGEESHPDGGEHTHELPPPPEEHSHHPAEDSGNVKEKGEESHLDGGEHTHELPPPPPEEHSHHPAEDSGSKEENDKEDRRHSAPGEEHIYESISRRSSVSSTSSASSFDSDGEEEAGQSFRYYTKPPTLSPRRFSEGDSAEENLKRLFESLRDHAVLERSETAATALCNYLKSYARANCLADDAVALLNCEGLEVELAKSVAIRYQASANAAFEVEGAEAASKCVAVVSFLRAYIDILVMLTPHRRVFREGASPSAALNEAFAHWGVHRDASGVIFLGEAPKAQVGADGKPVIVKPQPAFLETSVSGEAEATNSIGKRGKEKKLEFLSASVAGKHAFVDQLCVRTKRGRRQKPPLPGNARFVMREFFNFQSRVAGFGKLACDRLEEAVFEIDETYAKAVEYFNVVLGQQDTEVVRRRVALERNADSVVNFKRLCFALGALEFHEGSDPLGEAGCDVSALLRISERRDTSTPDSVSANSTPTLLDKDDPLEGTSHGPGRWHTYAEPPASDFSDSDESHTPDSSLSSQAGEPTSSIIKPHAEQPSTQAKETASKEEARGDDTQVLVASTSMLQKATLTRKDFEAGAEHIEMLFSEAGFYFSVVATEAFSLRSQLDPRSYKDITESASKEQAPQECLHLRGRNVKGAHRFAGSADCAARDVCRAASKGVEASRLKKHLRYIKVKTLDDFLHLCNSAPDLNTWNKLLCNWFRIHFHCKSLVNILDTVSSMERSLRELQRGIGKRKGWVFQNFASDAIFELTGFSVARLGGRIEKRSMIRKIKELIKGKPKLETDHVRFLQSQLSPQAVVFMREAFRPVLHPAVIREMNQSAKFYSRADGTRFKRGGLAKELNKVIREWSYIGMPDEVQKKIEKGLKTSAADYRGFDFNQPPPTAEDLSKMILTKFLASTNRLLAQPEWREAMRRHCRVGDSEESPIIQLARDSLSLARQAGEDILLVGTVVKANETHRTYTRGFISKMAAKLNQLLKQLLRLPPHMMQHAMYTAVVPDYQKIASVLRELGSIYLNSPQVFPKFEMFKGAAQKLAEFMQEEFRAGDAFPVGVPVTSLLLNTSPLYASMSIPERVTEFRRSVMSTFFAHLWQLTFSVGLEATAAPLRLQNLDRLYGSPVWMEALFNPFQVNSFRMITQGGDLGLYMFDHLLTRDQKRMLKRVKYGQALMAHNNMLISGKVYKSLGFEAVGSFITSQAPYFGMQIQQWIDKRRKDRIVEIASYFVLIFFVATTIAAVVDQINALVEIGKALGNLFPAPDPMLGNLTGQMSAGGGCGPMGLCPSGEVDAVFGGGSDAVTSPPQLSSSPVLMALFALLKVVIVFSLAPIMGPMIAVYGIVKSHWKFLERLDMALKNFFQWAIFKIKNGKVGRWFQKFKASRKAKKALKKLAKVRGGRAAGKKKRKKGRGNASSGEAEEEDDQSPDPNDFSMNIDDALDLDTSVATYEELPRKSKPSLKGLKKKISTLGKKKKKSSKKEDIPLEEVQRHEGAETGEDSTSKRRGSSLRHKLGKLARKSSSGSINLSKRRSAEMSSSEKRSSGSGSSLKRSLSKITRRLKKSKKEGDDKLPLTEASDTLTDRYSKAEELPKTQETQFLQVGSRASYSTDRTLRTQHVRPHEFFGKADGASLPAHLASI